MNKRLILQIGLAVVALGALGFGAWIFSLPDAAIIEAPPPVPQEEYDATLAALKPPKRAAPLIAIVGANEGTETTDYLMPFGILKRADVADVIALSTKPGPVLLYPVFTVEPQATIADFDAQHPDGADYVLVPAMKRTGRSRGVAVDQGAAREGRHRHRCLRGRAGGGECRPARGHRATTHWYALDDLLEQHPSIQYVENRRVVVDRGVATTTGITARCPCRWCSSKPSRAARRRRPWPRS